MNSLHSSPSSDKFILRGIRVWPTEAMKTIIHTKAARLLRLDPSIIRVRIDVERDLHGGLPMFAAKGHIEILGPDLFASVTTPDAYKSVDLLIEKLARKLRRRHTALRRHRHRDDIRTHADARSSTRHALAETLVMG
ncbi:HPF/RaiA family ribosome-associated protein [Horticoccus luteus]|uniref:HPF/RaiA family ribosome-associated protein n=1 Tax=Horticoccus luteus TaxID=2862869 RepID=A0A8F9TUH1_9BACT|nr:HPF/RaiA family ribosome-associated protein [Horticoccus luteus]QYM78004.1 HPF/RaiA family ribosome-associated protein [Horticoccus luteus]